MSFSCSDSITLAASVFQGFLLRQFAFRLPTLTPGQCRHEIQSLPSYGWLQFKKKDWKDYFYTGNNTKHAAFRFIECVRDCFLFQHVTDHTRQRGNDNPSTLNLIFSNEENMVSKLDILAALGKSDHSIIKFTINCDMDYQQAQIKKRFNKGNYDGIKNKLNSINWEE